MTYQLFSLFWLKKPFTFFGLTFYFCDLVDYLCIEVDSDSNKSNKRGFLRSESLSQREKFLTKKKKKKGEHDDAIMNHRKSEKKKRMMTSS